MRSSLWHRVLLGAVTAIWSASAAEGPNPAKCLPVRGEAILAGDLAAANPVFEALDPNMPVSVAPMAGARRVFRGVELAHLVRQNRLPLGSLHDVCFEWLAEMIPPNRLAEAMAHVLGYEPEAIEIVEQSHFPAPSGELVFAKEDLHPLPGPGRVLYWKGFVVYCAGRRFPVWAKVRINAPAGRVVARSTLKPGEPISERMLEVTVDTDGIANGVYALSVTEVAGRTPVVRIEPGTAIRLSDITLPPDVRAGDDVEVEVRNGVMRIYVMARAERSGRIGDMIPLINPESSAHFRARVESPRRTVVTLRARQLS